jgi:ABC-2 type transport system permease protein
MTVQTDRIAARAPSAIAGRLPDSGALAAARRIGAMVLRYSFLFAKSWPRLVELIYWPTVQVILWGLISQFFLHHSSWLMQASGALLAAALLWDVLFRSELGVAVSFMEEMWSRNLGSLFVAPLRPYEMAGALLTMSLLRTLIGMVPASIVAIVLYEYSIYELGLPLLAFFVNLMVMGWAFGLIVCGLLFRWGLGAESVAWFAIFAIAPISGIYYPIAELPHWVQWIAMALPPAHVFEGMRAVMFHGLFRTDLFLYAVGLNAVYLSIGIVAFLYAFGVARRRGLILNSGAE